MNFSYGKKSYGGGGGGGGKGKGCITGSLSSLVRVKCL